MSIDLGENRKYPLIVTLLVGLPASGKTSLINQCYSNSFVIDDPKNIEEFIDRLDDFIGHHNKYENIVISDPNLCIKNSIFRCTSIVNDILLGLYDITFCVFLFENNPEQCHLNSMNRLNKPVHKYIERLSKMYDSLNYYIGSKLMVWRPDDYQIPQEDFNTYVTHCLCGHNNIKLIPNESITCQHCQYRIKGKNNVEMINEWNVKSCLRKIKIKEK